MKLALAPLLLALSCGTAALAQDNGAFGDADYGPGFGGFGGGFGGGAFGVSLGYGTLGKTLEPSWRFGGLFGLRAPIGLGHLEADLEEDSAGLDYGGHLEIGGAGLLADFYPLIEGPRLTAGMMLTDMGAELTSETVTVGGVDRQVLASVEQRRALNPVLAVGYESTLFGTITWAASAGAILGEGFDVHASEASGTATQAEIDAAVDDLRGWADDLKVVPYLQVTAGIRF